MANNGPLLPSKSPNLPIAPVEYDQRYQDTLNNAFTKYFTQIDNYTQNAGVPVNNTTANRPTANLLVGQFYFDTTLGYPIWWSGAHWVNASGTTV